MSKDDSSSKYLDFLALVEGGIFDPAQLQEAAEFDSYNEYVAHQVEQFPEIMMTFLQYDVEDSSMFYLQLIWLSDYHKAKKKRAV